AGGAVKHWSIGPIYKGDNRTWSGGADSTPYKRHESLLGPEAGGLPSRPFFERKRNQYADHSPDEFVHIKDFGAAGDGVRDDTKDVQDAFNGAVRQGKLLFVDAGIYMLADTVTIPKGARVIGECWATFAAFGERFSDPSNPRPVLRVGTENEVGDVELQDLIVSTKGGTAGAILIEWNLKARSQGSAALWDVHARVGGALGTDLNPAGCPPIRDGTNPEKCQAAAALMHIRPGASGLFDNMWLWVADHIIDDPDRQDDGNNMDQLSVYVARGLLVESTDATWLYGTSAEHAVFYQYNFHNAKNIYAGMLQTEPPYFQPTPRAPHPFSKQVGTFSGDPKYKCDNSDSDGCDTAWAVILTGSENIMIGGAGTYSWFDTYTQTCIGKQACQKALWFVSENRANVRIQHLITIGATNMIVSGTGKGILARDNQATDSHPRWSHISIYDAESVAATDTVDSSCAASKPTFELPKEPPKGEWYPNAELGLGAWDDSLDASKIYVTIVNLAPYTFKLVDRSCYQMDGMWFGDVLPGHSRQNTIDYFGGKGGTYPVDDNGEAYYSIEGTGKTFVIKAVHRIGEKYPYRPRVELSGFGNGATEYTARGPQRAFNLIITGSEKFGFITSMYPPPVGWMQHLKDVIGPRTVNHVVMPGSHNAGMSAIGKFSWEATRLNTQNQAYNLYNQLRLGSRWFDLRVVIIKEDGPYSFHTAHTSYPSRPVGDMYGATGATLDEVIGWINQFTNEYPGEVIFLWTKYLWALPADFLENGRSFTKPELEAFYGKLKGINNRCPYGRFGPVPEKRPDVKFDRFLMSTLMEQNNGKGCVLIFLDEPNILFANPEEGIYFGPDYFDRSDVWIETNVARNLVAGNVKAWTDMRLREDSFIVSKWHGSWDLVSRRFLSIEELSMRTMYDPLFWAGVGQMSPVSYPNAFSMDYVGMGLTGEAPPDLSKAQHEMRTLAIGLNLYMISENCTQGRGKRLIDMDPPKGLSTAGNQQLQVVNGSVKVDKQLFGQLNIKPVEERPLARRLPCPER
ncbi:pectin lyase fold/virulence factor, partial [Schizothecium vesticola]